MESGELEQLPWPPGGHSEIWCNRKSFHTLAHVVEKHLFMGIGDWFQLKLLSLGDGLFSFIYLMYINSLWVI